MLVHKKRAEHSAILVGTRTAKLDNPSLNVRNWYGRSPIRLVIDRKQSLSPTLHLFDGSVLTLVFTEHFHGRSAQRGISPDRFPTGHIASDHADIV